MRRSGGEKAFDACNVALMVLFAFVCLYPFGHVLALSFNDGWDAMRGGISLLPRQWTLENYRAIFQEQRIVGCTLISIYRTVLGTALAVVCNSSFAFALAKRTLPGRRLFGWLVFVPLYFSGGIIPYFLVCYKLGLVNNLLVYVLPFLYGPFYILIMRVYYLEMSESLEESAKLDGAGYGTIFFRIYFPLSAPIIATVAVLSGVYHWNDWFTGIVMMFDSRRWTLQTLLLHIIQGADMTNFFKGMNLPRAGSMVRRIKITVESVKMAMLIVTVVPIVAVYPFLQRYLVKGMMIGSLKG